MSSEAPITYLHDRRAKPVTRRNFMFGGTLLAGGAALYACGLAAKGLFEFYEDNSAQAKIENLFLNEGLPDWRKFTIVPALLQIDPSVKVADGMFYAPSRQLVYPKDGFVVVQRPIVINNTLLRNVADYSPGMQSEFVRALQDVPTGLIAFYEARTSNLVYCDADANDGLIVPITGQAIPGNHLLVQDVDVAGSLSLQGQTATYPYTKTEINTSASARKTEVVADLIGTSLTVSNDAELHTIAIGSTWFGQDPVLYNLPTASH